MVSHIISQSKHKLHTYEVIGRVNGTPSDSEIIQVTNRPENFQIPNLKLIIIAKTRRVVNPDIVILWRLSSKVMVGAEFQLNRRPMNQTLVWGLLEVSLVWIVDIVECLDWVSSRVEAVACDQATVDVVDDQETVVVVG